MHVTTPMSTDEQIQCLKDADNEALEQERENERQWLAKRRRT